VSILLLTAAWLVGLYSQLGVPTPSSRWVYDAYQHKMAAAKKITGPRVLIVAGSNALFGIDSKQLEAYWHRPVINLAVNAGLGLPYILNISKQLARPGDVILMPMEYGLYLDDGSPNAQIIDQIFARDPAYWQQLPILQRLNFAGSLSPDRWLQGLLHWPDSAVVAGTYGAHHLDARGDQTHSAASDRTPADLAAVKAEKTRHYGVKAQKEKGGWAIIAAYAKWARQQRVCLIAVPSALLYHDHYDQDDQERVFYDSVADKVIAVGIPYVGVPRQFMYPADWFFDTDHHLHNAARKQHTAKLIAILNQDPLSYCSNK
jgi:hypothetical protein